MRGVGKTQRFKTVRDYINAQPRTVSQQEIARRLGIREQQLSMLKNGWVPTRGHVFEKLRAAGIEVAA